MIASKQGFSCETRRPSTERVPSEPRFTNSFGPAADACLYAPGDVVPILLVISKRLAQPEIRSCGY